MNKVKQLTSQVIGDIESSLCVDEWEEHTKTKNVIDVAWKFYQDKIDKLELDEHDVFHGMRYHISKTRTNGLKECRCGCGKVGNNY